MKVTDQLIQRLIERVAPYGVGIEKDGRLVDPLEQFYAQEIIAFLRIIEELQEWGWKCQSLSIELELEELIAKLNRLRPTHFIRRRLVPTHLRTPARRIEVLQPLVGRAPPSHDVFTPIPKVEQQGSCARSDLADSAY
jgi:hypothetical protein